MLGLKKTVFISFDYDNDRRYRYLLNAMANNAKFSIEFEDGTSGEVNSNNVGRIKAALSRKITDATHMLVVVGAHANTPHRDRRLIGQTNWQHWEINKAYELGKPLIGIKLENSFKSPTPLIGKGAVWTRSFTVDAISAALDQS